MEGHTTYGKIGLVCGILGIVLVLINWIPTILAIVAIGLGAAARKEGDAFGTYAMILGGVHFILLIIVSALLYAYITSLF